MTRWPRFASLGMGARLALALATLVGMTFVAGALAWVGGQPGSGLADARAGPAWVKMVAAIAGVLALAVAVASAYVFRRDVAAMTGRHSETIRHLEARLAEAQDAKAAAEAANRGKSRFLASMSHELRTPLNAVLGYAQILQAEPGLSEFQVSRLDKIRSGGEHLLATINDVLDLSRIEAGEAPLRPQPTNLPGLLRVVCNTIGRAAERKGLAFSCDLAPDLPAAVQVDGKRLEQALLYLLEDAVRSTERGGVGLRARRLESGDSSFAHLQFEIADSGVGIEPEQLSVLFRPFENGGDATPRHGGTGLSLAISQRIVAMMGGDIEVDRQPGAGNLFRFRIDVELADSAMAADARERDDEPSAVWRRILVVGDASARDPGLAERLLACGFELTHADGIVSALEQARRQRPDLILLGMVTADPEGAARIRRLREDAHLRGIALIALSPTAAPQELADSGADAWLREPLDVAALAAAIGQLRGRRPPGAGPVRADGGAGQAMVVPEAQELELLHELARIGNMRSIGERAQHLAALDPDYQPFANRLRDLAQRFQSRAILEWISELRGAGGDGVTPAVRSPTAGL